MKNIADIRQDYRQASLDENTAGADPIQFFTRWFSEARNAEISEVNAMTLATVAEDNSPNARIVLLKGLEEGSFVFYTNYQSHKGEDINHNPHVCLVFFWKELERQVRVKGKVQKVLPPVSDEYYQSRPAGSKLGAWASPQSQVIADRNILDANYQSYQQKFSDNEIPRPEHWGGYAVTPDSIEFWQGRSNRMHDRLFYQLSEKGVWERSRLAP